MEIEIIRNNRDLKTLVDKLHTCSHIGFDLETVHDFDGIDPNRASIVGGSFAYSEGGKTLGFYIPISHERIIKTLFALVPNGENPFTNITEPILEQPELATFIESVVSLLENPELTVRGSNLKYDYVVMHKWCEISMGRPLKITATTEDTMISSALLHKSPKGLKPRSFEDLGREMRNFNEVCPIPANAPFVDIDDMAEYAGEDAVNALDLGSAHLDEMALNKKRDAKKPKIWASLEGPNVVVLSTMEYNGFKLNIDRLNALSDDFMTKKLDILERLDTLIGEPINIGSQEQLSRWMFDREKLWKMQADFSRTLPVGKKSKGYVKIPRTVLEDIIIDTNVCEKGREISELVLQHRMYDKLINTYTSKLPKMVDDRDRVHCNINQVDVRTGRLSSSNPNLQNIPARTEEGQEIRKCFIADEGCKLVGADYSQMELRILAHKSRSKNLIEAYLNGKDIHQQTADLMGVSRRVGKTLNFGIVYGMGSKKLARSLRISIKEASKYLKDYFNVYPEIKAYKKAVEKYVKANGYIRTLVGRTRSFENEIRNGDFWLNSAVNTPIQGGAGDVIKIAQKDLLKWLVDEDLYQTKVKLLLQVHDELIFEVKEGYEDTVLENSKRIMEEAVKLVVPLVVDPAIGYNWYDIH